MTKPSPQAEKSVKCTQWINPDFTCKIYEREGQDCTVHEKVTWQWKAWMAYLGTMAAVLYQGGSIKAPANIWQEWIDNPQGLIINGVFKVGHVTPFRPR